MTNTRIRPRSTARDVEPAVDEMLAAADALFRAAGECCRQHERYAALVSLGASDDEQRLTFRLVECSDEALGAMVERYTELSATDRSRAADGWWRRANALWMASREYARRHAGCDAMTKQTGKHSAERFGELTLEYDLEASALLALRHAVSAYAAERPAAALKR